MTYDQLGASIVLQARGLDTVRMPIDVEVTPIPGLILHADTAHSKLLMVQPDGTAVDLLAVYHAAEDCIRNWHEGSSKGFPHFVGDFKRLTAVAIAVNGEKIGHPPSAPANAVVNIPPPPGGGTIPSPPCGGATHMLTEDEALILAIAIGRAPELLPYRAAYRAMGNNERAWKVLSDLRTFGAMEHPRYNAWAVTEKGRLALALHRSRKSA